MAAASLQATLHLIGARYSLPHDFHAVTRLTMTTITARAMHRVSSAEAPDAADLQPKSNETTGALIRRLRRHAHISQAELAHFLNYSQQQVSLWEHDVHPIPKDLFQRILDLVFDARQRQQMQRDYEDMARKILDLDQWPVLGEW